MKEYNVNEYCDRNGKQIEEGAYLIYENDDVFDSGIVKMVDNQLNFIYAMYIQHDESVLDHYGRPLCKMDLSKTQIINITDFNARFENQKNEKRYYDKFGLLIRKGMYVCDEYGGYRVEKKNGKMLLDCGSEREPDFYSLTKKEWKKMIISHIPKEYLSQTKNTTKNVEGEPKYIKIYISELKEKNKRLELNPILFELLNMTMRTGDEEEKRMILYINKAMKSRIAEKCGVSLSTVNHSITEFIKKQYMRRLDMGMYQFNPYIFGRSDWETVEEARKIYDKNNIKKEEG